MTSHEDLAARLDRVEDTCDRIHTQLVSIDDKVDGLALTLNTTTVKSQQMRRDVDQVTKVVIGVVGALLISALGMMTTLLLR